MEGLSVKIHILLPAPDEGDGSDHQRLLAVLSDLGYDPVTIPLRILRSLYPVIREEMGITLTLAKNENGWSAVSLEKGDTRADHYGLAVDYGSTTIHMQMIDMNSGTVIATEQTQNSQADYGTDILSRITYAKECREHVYDLQMATVKSLERLMQQLTESTGVDACSLPIMTISGNTSMVHFLLGLDAWTVFAAPYAPVTTDPGFMTGEEVGMGFRGMIYIVPSASNYVGGDIVSGILAQDMHKADELQMFFDIGTNGELVLGNKDWLVAGAGAAGPALEGYISRFGMKAEPGAIDYIRIQEDKLTYTTIAGEQPIGICGSGIIDLLAQMRLAGWINIAGDLEPGKSDRIVYLDDEKQYAVVYAKAEETACGSPLFFTQTDIKQYCDTKAAAFTMIECLLEAVGGTEQDIDHFHLTGAFPAHSDLESVITIGMLPDLPRTRYSCSANSSLDGARKLLLNRDLVAEAKQLALSIYSVQFASVPDFLVRMQAAKFIPHTDLERFPTIEAKLTK